ncbi:phytanoyl-CoA dioxygenase family protein [uncultured Tateyamaria sp.]|uniref:phytanoyl-CoA dioxygenase family protein n=1 Tax=uncultured Tateyamaria sp. TaxID=455651 RepID=UPI00262044E3|nr:phytanoyl-CoA dioxygenase family protein [uncultured Tateyamaria sp.]
MNIEKDDFPGATIADAYSRDGFVAPIDVMSTEEAQTLRADLEGAEATLADDQDRLALLRTYPDRLLPQFDALVRHPKIIEAVATVLGPDLLVYSGALFIKPAKSDKVVSWHQDLTYWGLDDAEEVTCWVALSPATQRSGCMKFVPGSHRQRIVEHVDTYAEDNLLSRGQEILVDVDDNDAVFAELQPGQASLHHGHLFHASGPNMTDDRRIGVAIRYIRPSMKQEGGERPLVALASGVDRFKHFNIAATPRGRLLECDFDVCAREAALRAKLFL